MTRQKKFLKNYKELFKAICDFSKMGSILKVGEFSSMPVGKQTDFQLFEAIHVRKPLFIGYNLLVLIVLVFSLQAFGTTIPLEKSPFCKPTFSSSNLEPIGNSKMEILSYCDAGTDPGSGASVKIANVTLADIDNTSSNFVGYEDFTSISTDLEKEVTYPFSWGLSYLDDDYEMIVWIDFNQDMDFDDPDEQVLFRPNQIPPHSDQITIPATATLGPTRMRVRLNYIPIGSNSTPCGNSFGGQVEDYTVNIIACPEPVAANTLADITPPICPGATFTLSISETQGQTVSYQWQSSPDNSTWTDLPGATSSTLNINNQSADTWYRCTLSNCSTTIYSAALEIASVPLPDPGYIEPSITPPVCPGSAFWLYISNYPFGASYQWQYSPNNINWYDIPGETDISYFVSNINTTTFYRCKATNCQGVGYSLPIEMTVAACYCTASGLTGPGEKISNVTLGNINNSSSSAGGYEDFTAVSTDIEQGGFYAFSTTIFNPNSADQVIAWIDFNQDADFEDAGEKVFESNVGGPYSSILYLPNTIPAGSTRMRIRLHRVVSGSNNTPCGSSSVGQVEDYTVNVVGCNINEPGNTLSDVAPPICPNTQGFTLSMANVVPAALYQWQSSPNNMTWTDITGATNVTHVVSSISSTTWYRCRVTNCDDIVNSTPLEMTVQALQDPGNTLSSVPPPICSGTSFTLSLSNNLSGVSYLWQYSPDNVTWTDIAGSNISYYYVPSINSTRWYRCRVTECGNNTYSTPLEMSVTPLPNPGSTESSTPSPVCPSSSFTLSLSNSLSGVTYQWQSSPNNAGWTNINGANNDTYDVVSISSTTWYRCQVSGVCGTSNSTSKKMEVISTVVPVNTLSSLPSPICPNTAFTLSLSGSFIGVSYQWQSSPDNSTWTNISGATGATYGHPGITSPTWFRCQIDSPCQPAVNSIAKEMTTQICYCSAGATSTLYEKISKVTFNNINNSSSSTAGYENFTNVSTDVELGDTYVFTATISNGYSADQTKVWIDLDQNGVFDEPAELLFVSAISAGPHSGTITIPGTALTGSTRMRVRLWDTETGGGSPCGNSAYGQVEDYTVHITIPPYKIWIGGTGNWDVATNWNPNGVPTTTNEVRISTGAVTIPASQNAQAKEVLIENGADLIITPEASLDITGDGNDGVNIKDSGSILDNAGTLTIMGSNANGVLCQSGGQLINQGFLEIPAGASITADGIAVTGSNSIFSNQIGATISIQKSGSFKAALFCTNNASVVNNGTMNLGTETSSDVSYGMYISNAANFTNQNTGTVNIQKTLFIGFVNIGNGIFNNSGTLNIGTSVNASIGSYGFSTHTSAVTNNLSGGAINIENGSYGLVINSNTTFNNYGTLDIGTSANSSIGRNGVYINGTNSTLTNQSGGIINIHQSEINYAGFANLDGGVFNNSGTLNIGTVLSSSIGGAGIQLSGAGSTFNNLTGGNISIDDTYGTWAGMEILANTSFNNHGTINVGTGSNPSVGGRGMNCSGSGALFTNYSSGILNINQCGANWDAIYIQSGADFENQGALNVGSTAGAFIGRGALWCTDSGSSFLNTASGTAHFTRSGDGGPYSAVNLFNNGYIRNDGVMLIGAGSNGSVNDNGIYAVSPFDNYGSIEFDNCNNNLMNGWGTGVVVNQTGGIIKGDGPIVSSLLSFNGGELRPGNSPGQMTFNAAEDFSNSIIEIEVDGITTAGVDYDRIVVNGAATLGGTLNLVINHIPSNSTQITILDATSLSGTFSTVNGLDAGWSLVYDAPNAGEVTLSFTALPVELIEFKGVKKEDKAELYWRTATEINNEGFNIQRSADGSAWETLAFIAGQGNSLEENIYTYIDNKPLNGLNYYRLQQMDFDGSFEYSRVIGIHFLRDENVVEFYPNPTSGPLSIRFNKPIENGVLSIYHLDGRKIFTENMNEVNGQYDLTLPEFSTGVYMVEIVLDGVRYIKKLYID